MYSRNSFGSFYPVDSSVHRLNPVVKLFNFIVAILLIILSDSLYINLFLFSLVLCMELLSFVPFKYYFRTFWSFRYIYILTLFYVIIIFLLEIFIFNGRISYEVQNERIIWRKWLTFVKRY